MQIKTPVRYHYAFTRWAKIEKLDNIKCTVSSGIMGQGEFLILMMGLYIYEKYTHTALHISKNVQGGIIYNTLKT